LGNRYGYAVASAIHGVGNILRKDFMIQVYSLVNYHVTIIEKTYRVTIHIRQLVQLFS
jgi:hypothetical protein